MLDRLNTVVAAPLKHKIPRKPVWQMLTKMADIGTQGRVYKEEETGGPLRQRLEKQITMLVEHFFVRKRSHNSTASTRQAKEQPSKLHRF